MLDDMVAPKLRADAAPDTALGDAAQAGVALGKSRVIENRKSEAALSSDG